MGEQTYTGVNKKKFFSGGANLGMKSYNALSLEKEEKEKKAKRKNR